MMLIPETLVASKLDDELVLLDQATGKYFGLNPVASRMFELLKETGEPDRVVERMLGEFDVEEGRLRTELYAFVELLRSKGLVTGDVATR